MGRGAAPSAAVFAAQLGDADAAAPGWTDCRDGKGSERLCVSASGCALVFFQEGQATAEAPKPDGGFAVHGGGTGWRDPLSGGGDGVGESAPERICGCFAGFSAFRPRLRHRGAGHGGDFVSRRCVSAVCAQLWLRVGCFAEHDAVCRRTSDAFAGLHVAGGRRCVLPD